MGTGSKIEWTESTWNPTVGCTKVSPGCDHCYAERITNRFGGAGAFDTVVLHPDRLDMPLRWRKPRRIFVNSMSDLFHDDVPDGFIARVWDVMAHCPQHTFQILTKRHARMRSWVTRWADTAGDATVGRPDRLPPMPRGPQAVRDTYQSGRGQLFADMLDSMGTPPPGAAYPLYDWAEGQRWWPNILDNVWLGVSVEDQKWADIRIPALLETPAAVRWISVEPLLGPVDIRSHLAGHCPDHDFPSGFCVQRDHEGVQHLKWVVVGGESGTGARPMHPDWVRSLRDQCVGAGVPFFFKQWGEWAPNGYRGIGNTELTSGGRERQIGEPIDDKGHRLIVERMGKKRAGRLLDGRTWDEYPDL